MHIKSTLAMQTRFMQKIYRHKYTCITAILLSTHVALEKNLISRGNTPREKLFFYSVSIEHKKKEIKRNSFSTRYWKFYAKSNIVCLIIFFLAHIEILIILKNYLSCVISYLLRMKYYMLCERGKHDK